MEEKGSHHFSHLCDSFYLFTMRSVNSNIKLLQYSKKVKLLQYSKIVILSKYYKSHAYKPIVYTFKSTSFTIFLTNLKNNFLFSCAARVSFEYFLL